MIAISFPYSELMNSTAEAVEEACRASSNSFGFGIWSHHILPMTLLAPELAKLHRADVEIVMFAVLLHDYAAIKDPAFVEDHHLHGAREARSILTAGHYPPDRVARVEQCILTHRGSTPRERTTADSKCVADCDAIVHLRELPSMFYVAYGHLNMEIDQGWQWLREKLDRDWEKLSPVGRDYLRSDREAFLQLFRQCEADRNAWNEHSTAEFGST